MYTLSGLQENLTAMNTRNRLSEFTCIKKENNNNKQHQQNIYLSILYRYTGTQDPSQFW